jgi:hypothetical protein
MGDGTTFLAPYDCYTEAGLSNTGFTLLFMEHETDGLFSLWLDYIALQPYMVVIEKHSQLLVILSIRSDCIKGKVVCA